MRKSKAAWHTCEQDEQTSDKCSHIAPLPVASLIETLEENSKRRDQRVSSTWNWLRSPL